MLQIPPANFSDDLVSLRPAERVHRYLTKEFDQPDARAGDRLPSVRQLAAHLKVSTATVQSVFQRLAEEGKVRSEVGNGSFWISPPSNASRLLRVGINLSKSADTVPAIWMREIYGGMLHALLKAPRPIALCSMAENGSPEASLEEELDGLVIFPQADSLELRERWEQEGRACINLNPPTETVTANFVSPDYYGASLRLARVWMKSGRRRIWLLMNPDPEVSPSVRLRCGGVAAGLGSELGRNIELAVHCVPGADEEDGLQWIEAVWDSTQERPDAIYCAGDALAAGVVRALSARGVNVPEEVSVVGGNGLGHKKQIATTLTVMRQPFTALGEALIDGLTQRMETKEDRPGVFLPMEFVAGSTTRDCENDLFAAEP